MNAHARYIDRGPYQAIHEQQVLILGKVTPIGSTAMSSRPGRLVYEDLTAPAPTGFDARANLASVRSNLRARVPSDPETVAAAQSALERMHARRGEDVNEWANVLASDSASIHD